MQHRQKRIYLSLISLILGFLLTQPASALSFDGFHYGLELGIGKMENTLKKLHEGTMTADRTMQINMLVQTNEFVEAGLGIRQSRYEQAISGETKQTASLDSDLFLRLATPHLEFGDFSVRVFGSAAYMLAGSQRLLYANSPEMTAATSEEARGSKDDFWATKSGYRYGGGLMFEYARTYGLVAEYMICEESWRADVAKTTAEVSKKPIKDSSVTGSALILALRVSH
jgi:hypothetical protein